MELTEKQLYAIGGWREMKAARGLVAAGAVREARIEGNTITGLVAAGGRNYKAGLRLVGGDGADNLCTCPRSRREGVICEHSLAAALQALAPAASETVPPAGESRQTRTLSVPARANSGASPDARHAASRWPVITEGVGGGDTRLLHLRLVFPQHLTSLLARGRAVQAGVEARVGERGDWRMADATLKPDAAYGVAPGEGGLWEALRRLSPEQPPGFLMLDNDTFADLLPAAVGTKCLTLGRQTTLGITATPTRPDAVVTSDGTALQLQNQNLGTLLVLNHMPFLATADTISPLPQEIPHAIWQSLLAGKSIPWHATSPFATHLPDALRFAPADMLPPLVKVAPRFTFTLEGSLQHLLCKITASSPTHPSLSLTPAANNPQAHCHIIHEHPAGMPSGRFVALDGASLRLMGERFHAWGFEAGRHGEWELDGEELVVLFFVRHAKVLEALGEVTFSSRLAAESSKLEVIRPELQMEAQAARDKTNWFLFSCSFQSSSGGEVSSLEVDRILKSGRSRRRRADGRILVMDGEFVEDCRHALSEFGACMEAGGQARLGLDQALHMEAVAREFGCSIGGGGAVEAWEAGLQSESAALDHALAAVALTPREYQKAGIQWLSGAMRRSGGALLADEMGLGKTLQSLALCEVLGFPWLVVCPASLTLQWRDEAARILPHRNSLILNGNNFLMPIRNKQHADIYITTYGIIREYAPRLKSVDFTGIILDEAQNIRNPESKTRRYLKEFSARFRLAMTGTPIENRVGDLWSLLDWAIPGRFGGRRDFSASYEPSVAGLTMADGGAARERTAAVMARRLAARISPHMLRRRKDQVAQELPQRTSQVIRCAMTSLQAQLYAEVARSAIAEIAARDLPHKRMIALTALLRLRQIATDPAVLFPEKFHNPSSNSSGKWGALFDILEEVRENNRKALVYSSFSSVLLSLSSLLAEHSLPHTLLHGRTTNRQAEITRFKTDPTVSIFLISLKAGGTGLNLSEADTVIHLDPWWNPAVEEQANARAHRIGQENHVHICKLVSESSVDEGILEIQRGKAVLAAGVLDHAGGMPTGQSDQLSDGEIANLLNLRDIGSR